jgi:hypothetical protein
MVFLIYLAICSLLFVTAGLLGMTADSRDHKDWSSAHGGRRMF